MKLQLLVAMILVGTAFSVHAEESTVPVSENKINLEVGDKKPEGKDIDEEITNARMRATLGSKNRWSFKSALAYSGGSVSDPFGRVRPAYQSSATEAEMPQLSGTVGINYRLTAKDSISLSTGLTINDPLHGDITKNATDMTSGSPEESSRYIVSSPSISWSRGYKAFGAQMSSGVGFVKSTSVSADQINQQGYFSFDQTVLMDLGNSRWSGGIAASVQTIVFGGGLKESMNAKKRALYEAGVYKRADLGLGLYPFAEYTFNDRYSFRTVFGYASFTKYRDEYGNDTSLQQDEPYQSVGLGISVTRDIYLYPNVQFVPKDIRGDRTNVALSTNINI